METQQYLNQSTEIGKTYQMLSKHIDDFKYLVLYNMRLEEKNDAAKELLHLDVNRISNFQDNPKTRSSSGSDSSGETLEQWVSKQKIKTKKTPVTPTVLDHLEQWLMNEAKKDLFAEIDAVYGGTNGLNSDYIREIGTNLISLADKLDAMKSRP